jgi:Ca-activated chloride channel family protein
LALEKGAGSSRTIVIATDGYVTVEEEVFDLIRNNLGDANVFAFGIGSAVNRHIIEGMARVGMGEPFVITKPEEAVRTASVSRPDSAPVLAQVKIDFRTSPYEVELLTFPMCCRASGDCLREVARPTSGKITRQAFQERTLP